MNGPVSYCSSNMWNSASTSCFGSLFAPVSNIILKTVCFVCVDSSRNSKVIYQFDISNNRHTSERSDYVLTYCDLEKPANFLTQVQVSCFVRRECNSKVIRFVFIGITHYMRQYVPALGPLPPSLALFIMPDAITRKWRCPVILPDRYAWLFRPTCRNCQLLTHQSFVNHFKSNCQN